MKVSDLPDQIGPGVVGDRNLFLWCWGCKSRFSAHRGDYFMLSDETVLECECSLPLVMTVEKYGRYWAVRNSGALVCVTVYKKGAEEVVRLFLEGAKKEAT